LDIAQVKALVSLEQVLARYGVLERLRRSGRQLQGRCPIHRGSNHRQFTVDLHKGLWRCFGDCDRGGDVIAFVAAMEGIDAAAAASLMAD
jgi:DNA primase